MVYPLRGLCIYCRECGKYPAVVIHYDVSLLWNTRTSDDLKPWVNAGKP